MRVISRLRVALPVPIVGGALRGRWWLPFGGGKVWRVLGGTYETEQTRLFSDALSAGQTVLDLGAHHGYYTLLASARVGGSGRVHAFEPDPRNAWYLRRHARLIGCRNVQVHESAVYDRCGSVAFQPGTGSGTGRVDARGAMRVPAVRMDDFVAEREIAPAVVKIDVEGAEAAVLDAGRDTLRRFRPVVFLSTHSAAAHAECGRVLRALDYRLVEIAGNAGEALCTPVERSAPAEAAIPAGA